MIVSHGPIVSAENICENEYVFHLEDGTSCRIRFAIRYKNGEKLFCRDITAAGNEYIDECTWIDDLEVDDYIQWTVDNWCEVKEFLEWASNKAE